MSTCFGLTSGFMCHFWYNFLDRLIPGSGVRIVLRKILYDQVIFSPVCISVCLVSCGVIEKKTLKQINGDLLNIGKKLNQEKCGSVRNSNSFQEFPCTPQSGFSGLQLNSSTFTSFPLGTELSSTTSSPWSTTHTHHTSNIPKEEVEWPDLGEFVKNLVKSNLVTPQKQEKNPITVSALPAIFDRSSSEGSNDALSPFSLNPGQNLKPKNNSYKHETKTAIEYGSKRLPLRHFRRARPKNVPVRIFDGLRGQNFVVGDRFHR